MLQQTLKIAVYLAFKVHVSHLEKRRARKQAVTTCLVLRSDARDLPEFLDLELEHHCNQIVVPKDLLPDR